MAQCKLVLPVAIGEEAVMADAMESVRQGVKKEAANELVGIEGHNLRLIVVTIILPTKGGAAIDQADEAGVGYRDTMGVAAEISEYLLGSAEGRLGVDHPLGAAQRSELFGKDCWLCEVGKIAEEAQVPGIECRLQALKEQSAEKPGKHAHRQEEAWSTANPMRAVEGWTAARHDAMHMRMMMQVLSPCMKHGHNADLGAQMLWVRRDHA
jgi:hypothetical protein